MNQPNQKLSYRDISYESLADCALLAKWENDLEIRHLVGWFPDQIAFEELATPEGLRAQSFRSDPGVRGRRIMILLDGQPVGEMNFDFGRRHMLLKDQNAAWLAIVIGEGYARGIGLGKLAMLHLESLVRESGGTKAELGVFEFNSRALHLYQSMGYKEIQRLPNFTFWNGKMWADIRMMKEL